MNRLFLRPTVTGRMALSTRLLSMGNTGIAQPAAELLLPFQGIVCGVLQLVARRILCIESSFGKFLEECFYNRSRFSSRSFSFCSGGALLSRNVRSVAYNGRKSSTIFMLQAGSLLLPAASTNFRCTCAQQTCHCGFCSSGRVFIQLS